VPERDDGGAVEDGAGESRRWCIGGRRRRLATVVHLFMAVPSSVFFLYCDKNPVFIFLF